VAMLEPLGRLNHPLPKAALKRLEDHDFPEVISSTLLYARAMALDHRSKESLAVLDQTLASRWVQIRIQSLHLIDEIAGIQNLRSAIEDRRLKSACAKEKNSMVKSKCEETLKAWGVSR
jgi:hypothetical protein